MVARLTPRVVAKVEADSPLACIRCTRAAFEASNALGRPIDCPRARRASRAAARRSRPSSSSSSANEARTPATMRPDAFDVSIPSRSDRNTIPRSPRSRIVVMTSAALRPRAVNTDYDDGITLPRVIEERRQTGPLLPRGSSRQLVRVDARGVDACCGQRVVLLAERLMRGTHAGIAELGSGDSGAVSMTMQPKSHKSVNMRLAF